MKSTEWHVIIKLLKTKDKKKKIEKITPYYGGGQYQNDSRFLIRNHGDWKEVEHYFQVLKEVNQNLASRENVF